MGPTSLAAVPALSHAFTRAVRRFAVAFLLTRHDTVHQSCLVEEPLVVPLEALGVCLQPVVEPEEVDPSPLASHHLRRVEVLKIDTKPGHTSPELTLICKCSVLYCGLTFDRASRSHALECDRIVKARGDVSSRQRLAKPERKGRKGDEI